jgi:beta-1,4-mannosyl-glycoprotein beta-1,4-N-acetylglucosaminyltransferase
MKKIKVYDCFPYFNEKELLEFRIKLLYNYVDGFYIVDADHTHGGHPKEFSCVKVLEELNIPLDKIKVIHLNLPSYEQNPDNYFRERSQRNIVSEFFEDNAVYIVSDCDEIINPEMLNIFIQGATNNPNNIMRISLAWLTGKSNLRVCGPDGTNAKFHSPFLCMKHHVENYTLSQIREDEACELRKLKYKSLFLLDQEQKPVDCGWHFSWMGGRERIKYKMKSFLHCYDGKNDIFTTAVGDIPSKEMSEYLDSYEPTIGSHDPYGRSDYFLKEYLVQNLPKLIFELNHLKSYFFGNENE